MSAKVKNVIGGLLPSIGLMVLGILFLLGGVGTLVQVMNWVAAIVLLICGVILIIMGIVRTKSILNTSGFVGALLLLVGLAWLPVDGLKLIGFDTFLKLGILALVVLGSMFVIDSIIGFIARRSTSGCVVELVLGLVAVLLGILVLVIPAMAQAANYVVGAVLVLIGLVYLIDTLTGKLNLVVRN